MREAYTIVPNLRHVANLISVELHHIDVIDRDFLACERLRSTFAGVRSTKHGVYGYILAVGVNRITPLDRVSTLHSRPMRRLQKAHLAVPSVSTIRRF